jgi:hypothetical protein
VNVPRFLRLPVFGFFFREYNRYFPDLSFLIISIAYSQLKRTLRVEFRATPKAFGVAELKEPGEAAAL